jgi:hypothetical protein
MGKYAENLGELNNGRSHLNVVQIAFRLMAAENHEYGLNAFSEPD